MTEADIRRIVEEVIGELYDNGQIGPVVIDLPITTEVLFSGNDIPVGDDIADMLEAAAEKNTPVVIRVSIGGGSTDVFVFNVTNVQEYISTGSKFIKFCSYGATGVNYDSPAVAFVTYANSAGKSIRGARVQIATEV